MRVPSEYLIIVDARNVQRSAWPNATDRDLVDAVCAWHMRHEPAATVILCFDGEVIGCDGALEDAGPVQIDCVLFADDRIVRIATDTLQQGGWRVDVATSDRALRERVEALGARVPWGGGSFLRMVGLAH